MDKVIEFVNGSQITILDTEHSSNVKGFDVFILGDENPIFILKARYTGELP